MQLIEATIGTDVDWKVNVYDEDQNSVVFAGTETLTSKVWSGDNQAVLFAPTVTFIDAPTGVLKLTVVRTSTASLLPGIYRLQIQAQSGSVIRDCFEGGLKLKPTPGAALALPVYCTRADLTHYAPWVDDLQDLDEDQVGFAEQRNLARQWSDSVLCQRYDAWMKRRRAFEGWREDHPTLTQFKAYLDADGLDLTYPMADRFVEINSRYALYLIADSQVGESKPPNPYQERARFNRTRAFKLFRGLSMRLDVNDDAVNELEVDESRVYFLDTTLTYRVEPAAQFFDW